MAPGDLGARAPQSSPRAGFDPEFLGRSLSLPATASQPEDLARLDYTHFTVVIRRSRRLAEFTAVNIDGGSLVELGRSDSWHLDPRLPATDQAGPEVYAANDLDRGHLVRRRDPVWGKDAAAANTDTFSYANAAPQVNTFNQSRELWLGLEEHVLRFADTTELRLSVFTGPVLAEHDPPYRGILIPKKFWKVAVWKSGDSLAAAAFLLDQGAMLDSLTLPAVVAGGRPARARAVPHLPAGRRRGRAPHRARFRRPFRGGPLRSEAGAAGERLDDCSSRRRTSTSDRLGRPNSPDRPCAETDGQWWRWSWMVMRGPKRGFANPLPRMTRITR